MAALYNSQSPRISVVVPVFNEESLIESTCKKLYDDLLELGAPFELVLVDDGSNDRSAQILKDFYCSHEDNPEFASITVVCLRANAGQHSALLAGFKHASGECIITIDADLQNSPDDIRLLYAKYLEGHDYVGSIRDKRKDSWWRDYASKAMNKLREKITPIRMTDQGCMFRLYDREIITAILASNEAHTFIPALAQLYARNPTEVVVRHFERSAGESKYSLFSLIHLNFDLITGFSVLPLQVISITGLGISALSFIFVIYMALRRLFLGPEVEGVFTLFGFVFFMMGIMLASVGVLGEYVGRIYTEVRKRPRYIISDVLSHSEEIRDAPNNQVKKSINSAK